MGSGHQLIQVLVLDLGWSRCIDIIFVFEEKEKKQQINEGSKKQGLSFQDISFKKWIKFLKQLSPKAIKYATFLVGTS